MVDTSLLLGMGIGTAGLGACAAGVGLRRRWADDLAGYVDGVSGDTVGTAETPVDPRMNQPLISRLCAPLLRALGRFAIGFGPTGHLSRIRTALIEAGLDHTRRPEEVVALQVGGGVLGVAAGIALTAADAVPLGLGLLVMVLLGAAGAFAPQARLQRQVDDRQHQIRSDLADVTDLLAISVEAGMALDGAIAAVSAEIDSPLTHELARMLREMELGLSRRDALVNLKNRSSVPELTSFVQSLIQADSLGMPLARVLKAKAHEMRAKRRQWARERAAKLPVKIMLPLVFCIFPAVLIVVLGPAFSSIGNGL